ncbi:type VII secretion system-associated protein [Streptomyces sp. A5-4]|uniref:type VII secretion system-associated protein n=1 Tax=Streptomyces sp. A5-4 TaxID=3384771 RepID=UPI003DA99841
MTKVTVLDSAFLKSFIANHIEEFTATLQNLAKPDKDAGPAISSVADIEKINTTIDATKPLIIGGMAGTGDLVGGAALNKVVQDSAKEILRIVTDQTVLFEDLEAALQDTVDLLVKDQSKNMESITPDDFIDIFEDVDSDLGNTGGDEKKED